MEGTPETIDLLKLESDIWMLNVVDDTLIKGVHDLHVWSISTNKLAMTAHVISEKP
jgi:cobalt-zinc-cadmium efflux system protein